MRQRKRLCFDPQEALHDVRFSRKLSGWEFTDFFRLLAWTAQRRDPTYIPAREIEDARLSLGMNQAKWERRVSRWGKEGIDLVQPDEGGGLLICYLVDQADDERADEDAASDGPLPLSGARMSGALTHSEGTHGGGRNGNGSGPVRSQPGRRYSQDPAAQRQREAYRRRKALRDGGGDEPGTDENLTPEDENLTPGDGTGDGNLTPSTGKPHAEGDDSGEDLREVPRARVGDRNTVFGGLEDSKPSENRNTVGPEKNLTPGNLTAENLTPPPRPPDPVRPARPQEKLKACDLAVNAVLRATGDAGKWKPGWVRRWHWCYDKNALRCWDEAIVIFAEAQRVRPVMGSGAIEKPPCYLRKILEVLLDRAGVAYVPPHAIGQAPEPTVSEEEAAEIRSITAAVYAQWVAEEAQGAQKRGATEGAAT